MNVMKNWGCLNKIKLVGTLLAGRAVLYLSPCFVTTSPFFRVHDFARPARDEVGGR